MSPRSHHLDVYDVQLHVATDRRQWATLRRKFPDLPAKPEHYGLCCAVVESFANRSSDQHMAFLVNLRMHHSLPLLLNTCAHEAAHGAGLILDAAGAEYDGNSEPFALLVGWLTQWLWEAMT